jgi:hypothetical protein
MRVLFDSDAKSDLRSIVHYIGVEQFRPEIAESGAQNLSPMREICGKSVDGGISR